MLLAFARVQKAKNFISQNVSICAQAQKAVKIFPAAEVAGSGSGSSGLQKKVGNNFFKKISYRFPPACLPHQGVQGSTGTAGIHGFCCH